MFSAEGFCYDKVENIIFKLHTNNLTKLFFKRIIFSLNNIRFKNFIIIIVNPKIYNYKLPIRILQYQL